MQRSRLTRREVLGKGLRLLAVAGPSVLLATACGQQAAPAKPAESKPAESKPAAAAKPAETKPAAPAAATTAPAVKTESKPAESKPAAAAKPAGGESPAMTKPGETPKRGGTLNAAVQNDFVTMWPAITTGPTASVCYDALIKWRVGDDGRWGPQPGLAESWELSDNAAVFKIRKGVKFHDGSDVNADAVAWNVTTWMTHPKSLAKSQLLVVNKEKPAEVVDDYTVKINLTAPAGSLLAVLSDAQRETGIASKVAGEKLGDELGLQAVGSGPFIFQEWQSGSQLIVNKNPNYWDKAPDGSPYPYLDKIHYRFVPDDSVRFVELRSGSADIAQLIRGRDVPAAKADPNLLYWENPSQGRLYRFFFNAQKPPFKDNLNLRKAIQYAIDREAMAKAVGGGVGTANKYDLTEGTLGYDPSVPFYSFDLDKAKAAMKESGVTTPFNVRLTVISREADQQQAQMIQQMLDKIGIKVDIEALERVAWGQKVRQANDFEMATQQTSTPLDPDAIALAWAPDGTAAYVRPNEPAIQDCLKEGRTTYDVKKRQETYVKCQTLMQETAWWGHMWIQPYNYLLNKKVKITSPFYTEDWREWSIWLA
ncbi:MAG: ABC transporter substrate-binding protein [Chloroflexota bacterium]